MYKEIHHLEKKLLNLFVDVVGAVTTINRIEQRIEISPAFFTSSPVSSFPLLLFQSRRTDVLFD